VPGVDYVGGVTTLKLKPQPYLVKCSVCGSHDVTLKGSKKRTLRSHHPYQDRPVNFEIKVPIVHCPACKISRQIDLVIADPKKHYTKAFAQEVVKLLMCMSVLAVAEACSLSWGTINSILKDRLEKKVSVIPLTGLRRIAIDELFIGKHIKYLTIVLDLDTGHPVFVGNGKAQTALEPFWDALGPIRASRIECVALDMGAAYIKAVKEHLKNAKIVIDHFHVVKLANMAIDTIRRREIGRATQGGKTVLLGTRYLLLRNREDLDTSKGETVKLETLLELNKPLATIYILKEDLRQLWLKGSKEEAEKALKRWLAMAKESGDKAITKLADTIEKHSVNILNFYDFNISTGQLEGINGRIRRKIAQAYGYRDLNLLKSLILAIRLFRPKRNMPLLS
jgi:transposase